MQHINLEDWLLLKEVGTGTDAADVPGSPGGMPPTNAPGMTPPGAAQKDPNITNQMSTSDAPQPVADDPQLPNMPDDSSGDTKDFETWKKEFLEISIKGDVEEMKDTLLKVRDRDLDPYQRKFLEDNLQIIFLREHSNIDKASKEIRKLIKEDLDHNNPATSVVNHITAVLEQQPLLNGCYIKLTGLRGMKGDIHRQFIAGLTGAVQVGSGAANEDLIFTEKDYSIRLSTRFNSRFGDVHLGTWSLKEDDPERYLKPPELKRLDDGSPEEKDVLRRRIVMESIADTFKTRAFIVNVVGPEGTIFHLGWDIATSLKAAYIEGKLVVRTKNDDAGEAQIDEDGAIVPFLDMKIMYHQHTGGQDEEGKPEKREVEFITRRYGQLFLTAQLPVLKEAASAFQGIVLKESPWVGNPSDLRTLSRCVPSTGELLLRQC